MSDSIPTFDIIFAGGTLTPTVEFYRFIADDEFIQEEPLLV